MISACIRFGARGDDDALGSWQVGSAGGDTDAHSLASMGDAPGRIRAELRRLIGPEEEWNMDGLRRLASTSGGHYGQMIDEVSWSFADGEAAFEQAPNIDGPFAEALNLCVKAGSDEGYVPGEEAAVPVVLDELACLLAVV